MPRLTALLVLIASAALAQTNAVEHGYEGRGVTLPPTSLSLIDEATAPAVNPAGLTFVGDPQLYYLHERSVGRDRVIDSLYLADTLFGGLGLGLGIDWVRSGTLPDYRRTTWSLSAGNPYLAFGLAYHLLSSSDNPDLDGLNSVDFGLSSRPSRYFSFAAVVRNVDPWSKGATRLTREYGFGVGVRPLGERYSLGVDYLFDDLRGAAGGRMAYTLQAEILRGLVISAGVSHGFRPADSLLVQVGLTLNTPHVGLSYTGGGGAGGLDHVVALRASAAKYSAISLSAGTVAMIDVDDVLSGRSSTTAVLLGLSSDDPYVRLTRTLYNAVRDPSLKGVVLKIDGLPHAGLGKAEELRQTVLALRSSGKKVIAVLLSAEDNAYHLASAADRIYAVNEANLFINGFAANPTFFGGTMEKLGVSWDVARVGAYKNAPDQLTRTALSKEQRETIEAYLNTDIRQYETAVTQGRGITREQFAAVLKEGLITPSRAVALRLIDGIVTSEELDTKVTELLPGTRFDPEYRPRGTRDTRWGERNRIAIIPILGNIAGGKSRGDPLGLEEIAGAETVIRAIKNASEDNSVDAIVLRV
ncbi:MAG: S49 family peptidase, partial [Myxococcaceae bacterium]